jgi:voltage-gated potassium channel
MMRPSHVERWPSERRWLQPGFVWLLPLLLLHLIISGFPVHHPLMFAIRAGVRTGALVMTLYVSRVGRSFFLGMVLMTLVTAAASIPAQVHPGWYQNLVLAAWSIILLLAPVMIFRRIRKEFQGEGVDLEVVLGALCAYLWIGGYFAFIYGASAIFFKTPFFIQAGAENQLNYLYFSFATLTTVGYGDLSPGYGPGRMLAVTEAVIGQLYLVSVVAIIVSAFVRQKALRS